MVNGSISATHQQITTTTENGKKGRVGRNMAKVSFNLGNRDKLTPAYRFGVAWI